MNKINISLSDFYGMHITSPIDKARKEHFIRPALEQNDLAPGHIKINYSYFGAVDKTLAGFVVLEDEGDDYTLLDLRDTGQVYVQDHEERYIYLKFDNLDDYLDCRKSRGKEEAYTSKKEIKSKRIISTKELAERYQWLVWFLANPMEINKDDPEEWRELSGTAASYFSDTWEDEKPEDVFEKEKKYLAEDPHLALYWLLHTAILGWKNKLEEVLEAGKNVDPVAAPLFDSFARMFGSLDWDSEVDCISDFRARRSRLLWFTSPVYTTDILRIDAQTHGADKAKWIIEGLNADQISQKEIENIIGEISPKTIAAKILQAMSDTKGGKKDSPAVAAVAAAIAKGDFSFNTAFFLMKSIFGSQGNTEKVVAALNWLWERDNYSPFLLQAMVNMQKSSKTQFFAKPLPELEYDLPIADSIQDIVIEIYNSPEKVEKLVKKVSLPEERKALAFRITQRTDLFSDSQVQMWAMRNKGEGTIDRKVFCAMSFPDREKIVNELRKEVKLADHPAVAVMLDILKNPGAKGKSFMDEYTLDDICDSAMDILKPLIPDPKIFDALMTIVENLGSASSVEAILDKGFYMLDKDTVIMKLSDEQATRLVKAMICTIENHPESGASSLAGHRLYYIKHPGALPYLKDAIGHYTKLYSERTEKDNKQKTGRYEDIVNNIYSIFAYTKARDILTERLFCEPKSFWRLTSAIKDCMTSDMHKDVMKMLEQKHDPRAASIYAYTFITHANDNKKLIDLLRVIYKWPAPEDEITRSMFKFTIASGIAIAIDEQQNDLVREAYSAFEAIEGPMRELHRLKEVKESELVSEEYAKKLEAILSGKADKAVKAAKEKAAQAAALGKPLTSITDKALGSLTGTTVKTRWFNNKQTGEIIFTGSDDKVYYFNGFTADASVEAYGIGYKKTSMISFLKGEEGVSEHIMFWQKSSSFVEVIRYDHKILIRNGTNDSGITTIGVDFHDPAKAAKVLEYLRQNPPSGMRETDPFYLPGYGAIQRYFGNGDYCYVFDTYFNDKVFGDHREAVAEYEKAVFEMEQTGRILGFIRWDKSCLNDHDMTLDDWFKSIQSSKITEVGNVLKRIEQVTKEHKLKLDVPFTVEVGAPASDTEIAVYAKACKNPIPENLINMWKAFSFVKWEFGQASGAILSPAETLAYRTKAQEYAAGTIKKSETLDPKKYSNLSAVVVSPAKPVIYVRDVADGESAFTHVHDKLSDCFWSAAEWTINSYVLRGITDTIQQQAPTSGMFYLTNPLSANGIYRRFEVVEGKSSKFWEIYFDPQAFTIGTRYGKIGTPGVTGAKRFEDTQYAKAEYEKMIAEKTGKGYKEVKACSNQ